MSAPNINNWFQEFYVTDVNHALQSEGFLTKGMTTDTDEVDGSKVYWNRIGTDEVSPHPSGISPVGLMNLATDRVSADIEDFDADAEFKAKDKNKFSGNLQVALTKSGAMAIGRKYDGWALDAVKNSGCEVVGNVGDTITLQRTLTGAAKIAGAQRGMNETFCPVPPMLMSKFMLIEQFSNSQYVGDNPLMKKMGARTWLGVTYFIMEDKFFTDRAPAANNIDLPLWTKSCLGRVTQELEGARLDWLPREKAWHIGQSISGIAKAIQPAGMKLIRGLMPTEV